MKRFWTVLLVSVALMVQLSLLPAWRPFGVVPNVMLVLVVLLGLEGTASAALAVAVVAGIALDLASVSNFGLWTGLLMLAALVTGMVRRAGFELSGGIVAVVLVVAGTALSALVILMGVASSVDRWPVGLIVGRGGLEIVVNLALMMALRPAMRWLVAGFQPGVMPVR
ncbi:MAG: hypothetical protein JWN01_4 [Patescibacteria group bacterium]|nr:hypothetical protein [Patescibacteria group bacterium]